MASDADLAGRVRTALPAGHDVREVAMFGGLSFLLDGRLRVAVRGDGDLLLRVDPTHAPALIAAGARPARMGGRTMSTGWLTVGPTLLTTDRDLRQWLDAALTGHQDT